MVFAPCSLSQGSGANDEGIMAQKDSNRLLVVSIDQFRHEKQHQMLKKQSGKKTARKLNIPKLDDANFAGTRHSQDCTLIITEGDSAKSLVVGGLSIIGRDYYGVFPLRVCASWME